MKRSEGLAYLFSFLFLGKCSGSKSAKGREKRGRLISGILVGLLIFVLANSVEVFALAGGPDYFGYTFADSNSEKGPRYAWIEIRNTGIEILPDSDDAWVGGIPIGFSFDFYGTTYNSLSVTSNGLALTGAGTSQYSNQPIGASSPHNFIAPFWDDLVTWGSAGAVYYETLGIAPKRMLVIEWYDVQRYSSTPSGATFEVILFEGTNNIKFQYQDVYFGSTGADNGAGATVGIEGPTGQGLQYSYNQPVLGAGLAILFKYPQGRQDVPAPKANG